MSLEAIAREEIRLRKFARLMTDDELRIALARIIDSLAVNKDDQFVIVGGRIATDILQKRQAGQDKCAKAARFWSEYYGNPCSKLIDDYCWKVPKTQQTVNPPAPR